jgi:hypothetical protein
MREVIHVMRAVNGIHKFTAVFPDGSKVHFGRQGYSDYTKHKNKERMERYLTRHRKRENWTRSGAKTPGFWSRWLLWSSPSLSGASIKTEKVLGKKIVLK